MQEQINELLEQRNKHVADARKINDQATGESRELSAEEAEQFDRLMDAADDLKSQIDALRVQMAAGENQDGDEDEEHPEEETNARRSRLAEAEAALEQSLGRRSRPAAPAGQPRTAPRTDVRAAFSRWLGFGAGGLSAAEVRALEATASPQGGYLIPPEEFVNQLIKFVDDMVFIRQMASVFPVTNAQSLGVPSLDTDPDDADWTTEIHDTESTEDSAMAFGKRSLHPHDLTKMVKVSRTLLRRSLLPVDQLVTQRLAYKFGVTEEKAFLTGSGADQPLGVFTASSNGISTGRDVSTGNTTTEIGADGLIEAKYSLKAQYMQSPGTSWLFHRDAVKQIRKLKDGEGQYLWRAGITADAPDTILDLPFKMSEFAPNTFATGLYVGILGDFKAGYWIADDHAMEIQRLEERYAPTNQVAFIGRMQLDGMPVLEEAFARVTLA